MSLILVTAGLAAMLTNWFLLRIGIHAMWMRYPVAISFAYAAFLAGIWLWLRYVNFTQNPKGKTWVPFAGVLAVAMVVAIYIAVNHPAASTLGEEVTAAVAS